MSKRLNNISSARALFIETTIYRAFIIYLLFCCCSQQRTVVLPYRLFPSVGCQKLLVLLALQLSKGSYISSASAFAFAFASSFAFAFLVAYIASASAFAFAFPLYLPPQTKMQTQTIQKFEFVCIGVCIFAYIFVRKCFKQYFRMFLSTLNISLSNDIYFVEKYWFLMIKKAFEKVGVFHQKFHFLGRKMPKNYFFFIN